MMNNGRIVEYGVHDQLMDANNKYATMVKSMMRKKKKESSNEYISRALHTERCK